MHAKPLPYSTSSPIKSTTATAGRKTAAAKRRFDQKKYAALLASAAPRVITEGKELERASRLVEALLFPERPLKPEEEAFVTLLLKLIDDYQKAHPLFPRAKPHELLQALMEEGQLKQADLLDVFGSRARVSEAVRGVRAISKEQAKKLSARFKLKVEAFL